MPTPSQPVGRKDLARGLDTFSAKGSIPEGYAEDLQNVDTSAAGYLQTRTGYEGYYGWLPFRVSKATQLDGGTLKLEFAESQLIDLSHANIGPLVVQGRVSSGHTGNFGTFNATTPAVLWFGTYNLITQVLFSAPSGTLTQTSDQTGMTSPAFWVGAAESTDVSTSSNVAIIPDDIRIDSVTYAASVDYTIGTSASGYVFYRDQTASAGTKANFAVTAGTVVNTISGVNTGTDTITTSTFHFKSIGDPVQFFTTGTLPAPLVPNTIYYVKTTPSVTELTLSASYGGPTIDLTTTGTGTNTMKEWGRQVTAAVHNLNSFNILTRTYDTSTATYFEIDPYDITIATDGTVHILPLDPAGVLTSFTGTTYLEAVPSTQVKAASASVLGGGPTLNTITITAPGSPYIFFDVYRYNTTLAQFEHVIVDSWSYDQPTDTVTIDYYLSGTAGEPVEVYWTTGSVIANAITVGNSGSAGVDNTPELTVWGLDHAGTYRNTALTGGHVTHLDSYKRVGERRLVAGLGGNLFKATSYAEGAAAYDMGSAFANFNARVNNDTLLAPLFYTTDPGAVRTRGVVYDSTVVDNQARVTAATMVSAGVVDYTLTYASKTGIVALGSTISTSDYLQVGGMAHTQHTGSWAVLAVVSDSGSQTVLRVANPGVNRATLNETGAQGTAGVFTDTFSTEANTNWLPGDTVISASLTAGDFAPTILSVSNTTVYVSGITSVVQLADGDRIGVRRTTDVVPLRDAAGNPNVIYFVRGDMLVIGGTDGLARRVRVLAVQPQGTQPVTFTGTGTVTTATTVGAHYLNAGDRVSFHNGTVVGEYTVLAAPSSTTFTFASSATSGTSVLQSMAVVLDEAITVEDGPNTATTLQVDGRWTPLEAPLASYNLPASTWYRYLDANAYDDEPQLRSTIVQDAMFFTNGDDEVWRFDGTYLTRAGLPKWQSGLFANNDLTTAGNLSLSTQVPYTSVSTTGKYFVTATASFAAGDRVITAAGLFFTVVNVVLISGGAGADTYQIVVKEDVSAAAASSTLTKVSVYKYYVRLNLLDRNRQIIAGYAAQSNDLVVDYTSLGQLKLRLAAPPALGALDYDRAELEVYRTLANGSLFYLQSRRPIDFTKATPYIDVVDSRSDVPGLTDSQGVTNRDEVMSGLLGNELGTGWEAPPRATCVTSIGNRLVLGNVTGYPEVDIVIRPAPGQTGVTASALNGLTFTFRNDAAAFAAAISTAADALKFQFMNAGQVTIPTPATNITRTATTFTVDVGAAHGLVVGRWVYLFQSAVGLTKSLQFAGWWQIASVAGTTFTVTYNNTATPGANDCDRYVAGGTSTVPVWLGTDGNYSALRDGNPASASDVTIQAGSRLAEAINASQRATTDALGASAWLTAFAGQDYQAGEVKVVVPSVFANTAIVASTTPDTTVKLYVNGVDFSIQGWAERTSYATEFVEKTFPSRIVRSYRNFPDIFDNCLATNPNNSDSAIDVNPSDGQVVTAILPFFGENAGASSASPLSQALVVVKEQSLYLVNAETKDVQKLDTRGLGGTAPRAVCVTQRGIVFVNEAGVFRLNRDMSISHIGLNLTGLVKSSLNKAAIAEAHAHHWAQGRRVKVSIPTDGAEFASEAWVYDYEREGAGQEFGAWTRHTDYPAVGWANLDAEAYWASQAGDVFLVRARGEAADYRDEAQAVAEAVVTLRAEDFGIPGVRKVVMNITTEVELPLTDLTGLAVETAQNLARDFEADGAATLATANVQHKVFRTALSNRRGTHIQVRYRHQVKDEALVLTGVVYTVGQLTSKLVPEQADLV